MHEVWCTASNEFEISSLVPEMSSRRIRALPATFFFPADAGTLTSLAAAVDGARRQNFRQSAVALFADDADAYLVAHASARDHTVVTLEQPSDGVK